MFRRARNGKLGHRNLAKSLMIHIELLPPFTKKHVQLNILVTQVTCTDMDLSFLVYFPLSNLKLYLILAFVMFFYCSKSIKVI